VTGQDSNWASYVVWCELVPAHTAGN
jgi:hypothetical protein